MNRDSAATTFIPKCIRVGKLARRLDVSQNTVLRKVAAGELPSLRIGRTILLPEAEVLEVLSRPRRNND